MYAVRLDSLDGSLHKVYSNRLLVILGKGAFAEALDETALPNSAVTNDNYLSAVIQLLHHCVSEAGRLLALKHFFNQVSVIGEDQKSRLFLPNSAHSRTAAAIVQLLGGVCLAKLTH